MVDDQKLRALKSNVDVEEATAQRQTQQQYLPLGHLPQSCLLLMLLLLLVLWAMTV